MARVCRHGPKLVTASLWCFLWTSVGSGAVLTDTRGKGITYPDSPGRVITTCLAADEMAYEILMREGNGSHLKLKAVSTAADNGSLSHIAPVSPDIKHRIGTNLEAMVAIKPDLAIACSYNRPEILKRLEQLAIPVFVLGKFSSFKDVKENIAVIGKLVKGEKSANQIIADMDKVLGAAPTPSGKKLLTFFPGGTVHGKGTTFSDIAKFAGAVNLAEMKGMQGWPRVSPEVLATWNPDMFVVGGSQADREAIIGKIRATPGFKSMSAAQKGNVIIISEKDLSSVSQHMIKAVLSLRKALGG